MSTYRDQADFIRKSCPVTTLEISTVDQFQGRDKDVIVLSLVHGGTADVSEVGLERTRR